MRWNFDPAGPLPRRAGVRTEGRSAGGRGMTSVAPLRGDRASRGGPNLPVSDPSTVTRRRGSTGRQPLAALPQRKKNNLQLPHPRLKFNNSLTLEISDFLTVKASVLTE